MKRKYVVLISAVFLLAFVTQAKSDQMEMQSHMPQMGGFENNAISGAVFSHSHSATPAFNSRPSFSSRPSSPTASAQAQGLPTVKGSTSFRAKGIDRDFNRNPHQRNFDRNRNQNHNRDFDHRRHGSFSVYYAPYPVGYPYNTYPYNYPYSSYPEYYQNEPTYTYLLSINDIVNMTSQGLSDDAIINEIIKTGSNFNLTPEAIAYLRAHNVSNKVIDYMLSTTTQTTPSSQPIVIPGY